MNQAQGSLESIGRQVTATEALAMNMNQMLADVLKLSTASQMQGNPRQLHAEASLQDAVPGGSEETDAQKSGPDGLARYGPWFRDLLERNTEPASSFELLESFRPETFTSFDAGPRLLSLSSFEEPQAGHTRLLRFGLMYSTAPSRWTRLSVTVTVSTDSRYWDLLRGPGRNVAFTRLGGRPLPASLHSELEKTLLAVPSPLEQDSRLEVFLGSRFDDIGLEQVRSRLEEGREAIETAPGVRAELQKLTQKLIHLNVPWYLERQVPSIPFSLQHGWSTTFISFLGSRWVVDCRFEAFEEKMNIAIYELEALVALRGAPRVVSFVGTIMDESSGIISGFMFELPAQKNLVQFLDGAHSAGTRIEPERWLKWYRQLVEGVSQVHARGFVLGRLGNRTKDAVGLDENDDIVLYRFRRTLYAAGTERLPPEYWHMAGKTDCFRATPQTDMYHLGLFLWRLATHACWNWPGAAESAYAETGSLPPTGEHVPRWLLDAIEACRTPEPERRPPAWALLEKMPSTSRAEDSSFPRAGGGGDVRTLSQLDRVYRENASCDCCRARTGLLRFQCDVCRGGDYDLCEGCLKQGVHCEDDTHWLREVRGDGDNRVRYWTSVEASGSRSSIHL